MAEFFIPYNVPSSKNSRVWTGRFFVVSKSTKKWRDLTKEYWISQKEAFLKAVEEYQKPYQITFQFIRGNKHQFDYVNPLQTVLDEMVTHGWLEDDNADVVRPHFFNYLYDKKNPGVRIIIQ